MEKKNNLVLWFISDFAGCGILRTVFPNDILNAQYGNQQKFNGISSCRFITDKQLLPSIQAIHFQRQITDSQIKFIQLCRHIRDQNPGKLNYKLIYDLDDLFTEIPSYNGASHVFDPKEVEQKLIEIKGYVDIITTSTFPLKKKMEELGGNKGNCSYEIIPNYLPRYIYGGNINKTKNIKPRIVWAGSNTHFSPQDPGDFGIISDLIKNTWQQFDWVLMGIKYLPPWIDELKNKITLIPWTSLYDFPQRLKGINADFGLAPLLNNNFNLCKSNVKLLDYWSANIIPICSDIKPYKDESKIFFKGNWQDDRDQILAIFNNEQIKEKLLNYQKRKIETYWLENNTKVYMDLFELKI